MLYAFLPAWAADNAVSVTTVGWLLALRAGVTVISRVGLGRLVARLGRRILLVISLGVAAPSLCALPFVGAAGAVGVMIGLGVGLGLPQPLTMAWVVARADPSVTGRRPRAPPDLQPGPANHRSHRRRCGRRSARLRRASSGPAPSCSPARRLSSCSAGTALDTESPPGSGLGVAARSRPFSWRMSGTGEDDELLGRPGHRHITVDRSFDALAERLRVDEHDQVELEPLRQFRGQRPDPGVAQRPGDVSRRRCHRRR